MHTRTLLALLVFATVGSLTSCSRESTAADTKTLGTKVQDSIEAGKDKLAAAQQEFRTKTDVKLKELDSTIAGLKQSAAEAGSESQAKLNELVQSLESSREELAVKLEGWKSVGADKWQAFTTDVSQKVDELQRAASDALAKAK